MVFGRTIQNLYSAENQRGRKISDDIKLFKFLSAFWAEDTHLKLVKIALLDEFELCREIKLN